MNRNFATIEDGRIRFAPTVLTGVEQTFEVDGERITDLYDIDHPSAAQYRAAGYLPVVSAEQPEAGDGYHYVEGFEPVYIGETLDHFAQAWERVEDPNPEDRIVTPEEFIDIVFRGAR